MTLASARRIRLLAVGVAAIAGLTLSGCSVIDSLSNKTERDETGQVTEANEEADVFDTQVGDCIGATVLEGEVETLPQVPCSEPHESEAYYSEDLPDGDYPGLPAIEEVAGPACTGPAFDTFVGIAYLDSLLEATYLHPTESSWAMGDREILCLIYDPAGPTTGTLEAAAR